MLLLRTVHIDSKPTFIQFLFVLLLHERSKIIREMRPSVHPEVVQR